MAISVLLDLSIGDNVDEAFALALACASPELELVGVSTPYRPEDALVRLTRRLLHLYGRREVAVAGRTCPAAADGDYARAARRYAQRSDGELAPLAEGDAVDFMYRTIARHPGTTLVATSPLTNVADLLRRHPDAERYLRAIVFMGGWMSQALPEWNMRADPQAVDTILRSKARLQMIGYEVTLGCGMKHRHVEQFEGLPHPGARLLHALCRYWARTHGTIILHDPLTLTVLCRPHLVQMRHVRVKVDLRPGPGLGAIFPDPDGRRIELAAQVDVPAYLDFVMSRVLLHGTTSLIAQDPSTWVLRLCGAHQVHYYRNWSLAETASDWHTLLLVKSGRCLIRLGDTPVSAAGGCVVYVPRHCPYSMEAEDEVEATWLQFDVLARRSWGAFVPIDRIPELPACLHPGEKAPVVFGHADEIVEEWRSARWESPLFSHAYLSQLLAHLFSLVGRERGRSGHGVPAAVHQARRYIEAHAREAIDLDTLSSQCGVSKFHLIRSFKEAFGVTPMQYHTHLRMHQARRLLAVDPAGIKEVAAQVGYGSVAAFTRAFRRVMGVTPGEYRKLVSDDRLGP